MKRIWLLGPIFTLVFGVLALGAGVKTLYWNLGTEPPTIDPSLASDTTSVQVVHALFMGLTDYDDATMAVIPRLATAWEASEDGLTWTFHLRKDVMWTDGSPVTAHDVEFAVKRTLDPATASDYGYVLTAIIAGAEAYNSGTGSVDDVGVNAIGNYTVQFRLIQPAGYFPSIAGLWVCNAEPQKVIEKYGDEWTKPENIVTCGPYKLVDWTHEDHMVLYKNGSYFDAANVKIDQIYCYMIVEVSTAMTMYEAGNLDVTGVPLPDMDRVKADPVLSKELYIAPRLCTYYYGFNNTKPPFDNVLVRKAFASAIDRQSLIDYVLKGDQKPAQTFTCPGIFGYVDGVSEGIGMPYDPEAAKKYLAEAGYPDGKDFPEVTLMFNTSESHAKIAQFIQQSFQDTLSVTVNLANQEWKVYIKTCTTDAPQIYRMGWCADYPDANNWVNEVFNSKSPSNYAKFNDPKFDAAVEQAARETDPAKRLDLYKQAETLLVDTDCAIAPIYFYTRVVLTKSYVVRTYAPLGGEKRENWDILPH